MAEKAEPRRRARLGQRHEPGSELRPEAEWWDAERIAAALPEELRGTARLIQSRLFLEERSPRPEIPKALDLTGVRRIGYALRDAIHAAHEFGAAWPTLRVLHARLDRELIDLSAALLDRGRDDAARILRDVSHDIRSPLNSILFLADTLYSEHGGDLNDAQRRQVGVLYTAAVSLVGLVNDLIDATRTKDPSEIPVTHASLSVSAVLSDVESLVGPLAMHRGVNLHLSLETMGRRLGDRRLLARVLINLVTNAIEAAGEGGRVEVRVTERPGGDLALEVGDDGAGEDVARLRRFLDDEFEGAYPVSRSRGWTHGLGLTISGRLVQAAGGEIAVTSQKGSGTMFRVSLPFPRSG